MSMHFRYQHSIIFGSLYLKRDLILGFVQSGFQCHVPSEVDDQNLKKLEQDISQQN